LMKRNAQMTLDWKQLHHEILKLREYVEWWDAAMKWKIERISDHVTQHHLIFICMKRLDFLQICNDSTLINRFEIDSYRQFVDLEMKSFFSSVTSWSSDSTKMIERSSTSDTTVRRWPMSQALTAWSSLSQHSGSLIYQDASLDENSLSALSRLAENISASSLH
jgi:hypothetical protein